MISRNSIRFNAQLPLNLSAPLHLWARQCLREFAPVVGSFPPFEKGWPLEWEIIYSRRLVLANNAIAWRATRIHPRFRSDPTRCARCLERIKFKHGDKGQRGKRRRRRRRGGGDHSRPRERRRSRGSIARKVSLKKYFHLRANSPSPPSPSSSSSSSSCRSSPLRAVQSRSIANFRPFSLARSRQSSG